MAAIGPVIDDQLVYVTEAKVDEALFVALRNCVKNGMLDWVVIPRAEDVGRRVLPYFPIAGMVAVER